MHYAPVWNVDSSKILTRRELATVLTDLKRKAERQANAQRNLAIVRLACCCGLRVSEIGSLQLDDVLLDVARPHLRLRRETTKGKKARCVPLWWDAGTLADLAAWKVERVAQGADGRDPFVCSVLANRRGQAIQRAAIRRRFLSACYVLGPTRVRTLTIHHGRHTFISHALAGGRTLAEVRAAAGHANVAVTSGYAVQIARPYSGRAYGSFGQYRWDNTVHPESIPSTNYLESHSKLRLIQVNFD